MACPAPSTVHEMLRRHGRIVGPPGGAVPPTSALRRRCRTCCGRWTSRAVWQLGDGGRCHPLTVMDDHSRYELCLAGLRQRAERARCKADLERTFRRYGLPEAFFVDNGAPLGRFLRAALDPAWRVAAQAWHRRPAQPALSPAEPRQERALSSHAQGRGVRAQAVARSRRGAARLRCIGASVYNFERPKEALDQEVPASRTGEARNPCRTACRRWNTTSTRPFAPLELPRITSASRAGPGRCRRPSAASASPSDRSTATANTASASELTRSQSST